MKKRTKYILLVLLGILLILAGFEGFAEKEFINSILAEVTGVFFIILGTIMIKKWKGKEKEEPKKEFKKEKKEYERIEFKRKCSVCGKVWHSLNEREAELQGEIKKSKGALKIAGWGMLVGDWSSVGSAEQSKRNVLELEKELDRLKSCPKCNSHNYTEKKQKLNS